MRALATVLLATLLVAPLRAESELAGFAEVAAGRYQALAQSGPAMAEHVNRFMNLMLDQYARFFANWTQPTPARVVVFAAPADFRQYLGRQIGAVHAGLTGVCQLKRDAAGNEFFELVAYESPALERVLAHEGFHQFIAHEIGTTPIWFNEGLAQYFETSAIERGRLRVGELNRPALATAQALLRAERGPAVQELIALDQATFYRRADECYPLAWALGYYLMEREGRSYRAGALRAYAQDLKAGRDPVASFNARFARDPRQFQYDFASYILRLR